MEDQQAFSSRPRRLKVAGEIQTCLIGIAIERIGVGSESEGLAKPGALYAFGVGKGEEGGMPFTLSEVSESRWEIVRKAIALPDGVEHLDCVVKSEAGEDIGFVRLSTREDQNRCEGKGFSKEIENVSTAMRLRISWETFQIRVATSIEWVEGEDENRERDMLCQRARGMLDKFRRTQNLADISEAISMQRTAVDMIPENLWWKLSSSMNDLGTMFRARFGFTGCLNDVSEAISSHKKATQRMAESHGSLPRYLDNLGESFLLRSEHTGDQQDIAEALSALSRAARLTSETDPELPYRLHHVGNAYFCRFKRTHNVEDLAEAITKYKSSMDLMPEGHGRLPRYLSNLGVALVHSFDYTADLQDITDAISAHTKAVSLTPEDDPNLPNYLNNLGISILRRFERSNNLQDLNEAIAIHRKGVSLTPSGHSRLPFVLRSLGRSLKERFKRTGVSGDISEAISRYSEAVALSPEGHIALPSRLDGLGESLSCRFESTGDIQDIMESISAYIRALSLTPEGDSSLHYRFNGMGSSFMYRFEHTGDLEDIAEAITAHSRALSLTPDRHIDLPSRFNNLGNSFTSRFDLTADPQDIVEAISAHQKAVASTQDGDPLLPSRLDSLGISLQSRAKHTGCIDDVREAISIHEKAVSLTPEDDVDLPSRLSHLGSSLLSQFELTGDAEYASEAISIHARVVELTPEGHRALPTYLNNLGNAFLCRFKRTDDCRDIMEGISMQKRAVSLTPVGRADKALYLANLGQAWSRFFASSALPNHLEESIAAYKLAATCPPYGSRMKVHAAIQWATLLNRFQPHSTDILAAFDTAIRLLALTAGLEQTVERRHAAIQSKECARVPLYAAATAVRLEHLDSAVEWMEQGRCLVWGQQSKLRTPLDNLRDHDSVLAQRVKDLSRRLDRAGTTSRARNAGMNISQKISVEDEARTHLRLAREWDGLLRAVRAIPGFQSFLQPSAFATLIEDLPPSGPVVIINVHASRCDAIALLAGLQEPLHIPLPLVSLDKVTELRDTLTLLLKAEGLRQRGADEEGAGSGEANGAVGRALRPPGYRFPIAAVGVKDVLAALWKCVVEPILQALAIQKRDAGSSIRLPRLWWCPTGPLSFLPLHAAGVYSGSDAATVMDYVVSSYTPTVAALAQRVKRASLVEGEATGLFLTCQPKVPGAPPISGTTKEVRSIHDEAIKHSINTMKLEGDSVNAEGCLEFMERFSSIHLACHASQNAAEPLKSRFLFHNGRLHLSQIMQRDLKNADLAFLSACETGVGEEKLSDEAVHLAAGMLAAGYKRVVATMWRIGDAEAPQVAIDFYQYLWSHREDDSSSHFDGSLSAYALHHATQRLRGRLGNSDSSLLSWAPFVHFGY